MRLGIEMGMGLVLDMGWRWGWAGARMGMRARDCYEAGLGHRPRNGHRLALGVDMSCINKCHVSNFKSANPMHFFILI